MNKRMVTFVSIVITVFIIGTAAVIIRDVSANKAVTDPQVIQDQLLEREQVYNQVISEANQRIEQLNTELNNLQEDQATPSGISPESAALIALTTTNYEEPLLKLPELVDFEGKVVYEVQVKSGIMYLDAQTGEIVFNGVPQKIDAEQAAIIAGEYLGGMDPKYGVVKQSVLNGSEVFQVAFNNYIVYMDQFGNVLQAQVLQYTEVVNPTNQSNTNTTNNSTSTSHSDDDHEDDHEDDHDDDHD